MTGGDGQKNMNRLSYYKLGLLVAVWGVGKTRILSDYPEAYLLHSLFQQGSNSSHPGKAALGKSDARNSRSNLHCARSERRLTRRGLPFCASASPPSSSSSPLYRRRSKLSDTELNLERTPFSETAAGPRGGLRKQIHH